MPIFLNEDTATGILSNQYSTILPEDSGAPSLTRDQYNAASLQVYNRVNGQNIGVSPWEHVGRYALGTAIDTADTLWASPLNPMGNRGDVWAMASEEEKAYYERNKSLIEGSSAVVGGLMVAVAAEALVIPRMAQALASFTSLTGRGIWAASRAWNAESRVNMLVAQKLAAESGEAFGLLSSPAGRSYALNRSVAGAATMTRTMPAEYALMWNNESFNSGEWGKEGFWLGAATVLGAGVGLAGARAITRRTANSQEIRDIRSAPMAMAGVSNNLMSPEHLDLANRIDPNHVSLKESAYTTDFLLASRSANPSGYDEAAENASRLHKMRDEYRSAAVDSMQKIISKGISGVETLKQPAASLPEIRNVVDGIAKVDPFVFHGMSEMGIVKTSIDDARAARKTHIDQLYQQSQVAAKKGNQKEAMRLARTSRMLKLQEDSLLVNGSWMAPDTPMAKAVASHNPQAALAAVLQESEIVKIGLPNRGRIRIDAGLTPTDDGGRVIDVADLTLKDRLYLDEASGALVKKLSAANAKTRFKLTDKSAKSWYSLDLAAAILEKGGKIDFDLKGMKLSNLEDIQRESLRQKASAMLAEVGPMGRIGDEIRYKYNLPAATALENLEDSAGDGFRAWAVAASKKEGTTRELAKALTDSRVIQGIDLLPPSNSPYGRVDGDMLRFNRDKNGNWMRPMLGYFDQKSSIELISERGHSNAMTLRKAEKTAKLVDGKWHVNQLARDLVNMPELQQAMDVAGLHSDQLTGTGGGVRQLVGEMLPKRFRFRDNATMLAATKLQETAERHGLATFKQIMESVKMQEVVTQITSTGHAAQRAQLDQYFSLRSGWDIDDAAPTGNGFYGFLLSDTPANRKRLGMDDATKWEPTFLRNERLNQDIVVDAQALDAIERFNAITEAVRESDNALRAAKGLSPIEKKSFYAPPPNTKGAFVGFVFDPGDKLVPGRTIVARSQDEYNTLLKRTLGDLGSNSGYTIRSRDQLESLRDIWDEAQMDWIDPGISSATNIGQQKGGLTGAYVKQGAFNEALEWVKRKAVVQSQDTLKSLMDESLQVARAQGVAERVTAGGKPIRNVFDEYEHALTGQSKAYSDSSIGDAMLRNVERHIDKVLEHSAITTPARHIVDLVQRIGMDPSDLNGKKTYESIMKTMGKYTPFANATEYLESRGVARPPTVKGMAQTMNTLAASVLLRWFEMPHAVMNGLGLIATMPALLTTGKAPISTFMTVKGKNVPFVDGVKIMSDAMKDMFAKKGSADWKYMERMGDSGQSVMEYHQQLGAIQSQAGFMKWVKEADKWVSIASDKSENWSRQLSHFVGLRIADYHGIDGMAARHNFAREIANSMIADYAPINRPELFNSGLGSMIGLFQSYALNQYTKMFRWMENGQYKQMGIQAAMQASMFGLPGTYGVGHLLDLRDSTLSSGSDPTALDLIYEHYGPVLGGAIAHGGVSELTQLAMWTRGDMNFRIPGASGTLAPLDIGTKVARAFTDSTSAFLNAMPGEGTHAMMEVIQREMPNRVLRSWLTLLNGGAEIDAYGQVMTETNNWLDTVARVVGVRSRRQQSELEAFYAGKGAMERDAAKMEKLRESFRSAVRNAGGDMTKVSPIRYFNDYVEAGGNPRMFKTWSRNLLRDSDSARAVKSLTQSMTTPRSALETWRFGAYGAYAIQE